MSLSQRGSMLESGFIFIHSGAAVTAGFEGAGWNCGPRDVPANSK